MRISLANVPKNPLSDRLKEEMYTDTNSGMSFGLALRRIADIFSESPGNMMGRDREGRRTIILMILFNVTILCLEE